MARGWSMTGMWHVPQLMENPRKSFVFGEMWHVPLFSADGMANPVTQNHPNCGKSGHRNGANPMTGFSTSKCPQRVTFS